MKLVSKYQGEFLQAISIVVEDWNGCIAILLYYSLPKHAIKREHYITFFKTLDNCFNAAEDYNAKHTHLGSKLILSKKRELLKVIEAMNLAILSTKEHTYLPSDNKKTSDLLDFRGISINYYRAESYLELPSDHSPVIFKVMID
jgi:hypothetical protein